MANYVTINVLPLVLLWLGVFESSKHGLTWLGVSLYGASLSSFVFAQWVINGALHSPTHHKKGFAFKLVTIGMSIEYAS